MTRELDGLREADTGPSKHACGGSLVDAIISRRRLVLVCYDCDTYWHTGRLETGGSSSLIGLVRAADEFYRRPKYIRLRHQHALRDAEAEQMYRLYCRGMSLSQIAARYEVTRQSIFEKFSRRGFRMRPLKRFPAVEFNGARYAISGNGGFYRKTDGNRSLLHHDVWEYHCGPAPDGCEIHHVDGDRHNNGISDLALVSRSENMRMRNPLREVPADRRCHWCGETLTRKARPDGTLETPSALMKRKYCGYECFAQHRSAGYGAQADEVERRLGIDIVTGQRLPGPVDAIRGLLPAA